MMTRLATTAAILRILVFGMVAAGSLPGCTSDHSGLGLPNLDAQAPRRDAPASNGGVGGAGHDAPAAGSGGSGGVSESGGITVVGGSSQNEGGAGGSIPSGGAVGGFAASGTGGSTPKGGTTGAGGATQAGGSGGTTVAGGAGGTAGVIVSGGTRTGGTTSASGTPRTGGTTGASGGGPTGGAAGSGGTTRTGGATGSGGSTPIGGTTGTGGTGGRICGAGLKSCMTNEFCEMPTGLCDSPNATGTCVATPGMCGDIYQPVCGCDGTTYPNDCERQVAHAKKRSDGSCPDAGVGGSGGSGGSTASGGRTGTGGTGGTGGVGGSFGGHPECVTADDCQLFSDCCNCLPIPVGTSMPSCLIACIQSNCAARGLKASDVACIAGRCTFSRACKPAAGICPVMTPTPQCPAGQAPLFVGNCPSGGCAKVEDCSEVSSCDACTGTTAAPTGLLCATFQTLPPSYHCVTTPQACVGNATCSCMGICSGGLSCIAPDSTTLTCQCPNC
jgi:hypothetical protein